VIVLGIETSTPQTSVAFANEHGLIAATAVSAGRTHHETVLPAIEQITKWTGVELANVAGVAVGIGPGLFTGIRVGVEIAKSLAQTLQIPILGVPSLDILAFDVRHARRTIGAAIDARRGEVFACLYDPVPGGVARRGEFMVLSPEQLAAELQATGEDVLLTGNGATLYRQQLEEVGGKVEFASQAGAHPQATALVELALPQFAREEHDPLFEVAPIYLRKSDAEIAWDRRRQAAEG
jgi:tRNA threonylcarbamoyladenosine biosynthesis protein TsaB